MQDGLSSTVGAVEGPQSDFPGKLFFKLAESLHRFGDTRAVGQLTSEKLLEIAEAARSFQTPQSGYMLFEWIDKRYHASHEVVDGLAQY